MLARASIRPTEREGHGGAPNTIGAKVLVFDETSVDLALLVTPGPKRLDNRRARESVGKFRLANRQEMASATHGLEPGRHSTIRVGLPGIEKVFVDQIKITDMEPQVGEGNA